MFHDFSYFGPHIKMFMFNVHEKCKKLHVLGIHTDPDRHALNADPDPAK
jgi:hypothetical protein